MSTPVLVLRLPPPPTVNNLFLSRGRRRIRTPRYRAWQERAGWQLVAQRQGCVGGPWEATIVLPAKLRGDVDNYSKPLLDLLVTHRVVDADLHCPRLTIQKSGTDADVVFIIWPAM